MPNGTAGTTPSINQSENVLYVVLHGLISLVEDLGTNQFTAYLLEMGDEHSYLYGNWLSEDQIPRRRQDQNPMDATLVGVDPFTVAAGTNQLDPKLNAVLRLPVLPSVEDPRVRAVFRLPRPRQIHHFISGQIQPGSLSNADPTQFANSTIPNSIAGIRLFEYTFSDVTKVALTAGDRSPLWTCPALADLGNNRKLAVLHIYDEPAHPLNDADDHNLREFNLSMAFLGVSLTLTKTVQNVTNLLQPADLVPGLLLGEITSLDQRERLLLDFEAEARSDGNLGIQQGSGGQVCSGGNGTTGPS